MRSSRRKECEPLPDDDAIDFQKNPGLISPWVADLLFDNEAEKEEQERREQRNQRLEAFIEMLTEDERKVLKLMGERERSFVPYAEILGITALPQLQQRKQVNRLKNGLYQRLKRWMLKE